DEWSPKPQLQRVHHVWVLRHHHIVLGERKAVDVGRLLNRGRAEYLTLPLPICDRIDVVRARAAKADEVIEQLARRGVVMRMRGCMMDLERVGAVVKRAGRFE